MTKAKLGVLGVVAVMGLALAPAPASADAAKLKEIRKLLQLTGAAKLGRQIMEQMLANFKQSFPKVPEKFWTDFMKKAKTEDLFEQIVPVYDKHLSLADIKGLITFYTSPVGKKFVAVQPQLVAESMEVGRSWGQKLATQVMGDLKKKGHIK